MRPLPNRSSPFFTILLVLIALGACPPLEAAPIPVRFVEGATRGFLLLHTAKGTLIGSGDLYQVARDEDVKSRMVFNFKDGSLYDETVVFTQKHVFTMEKYDLIQRGPAFPEDSEISLDRAAKKYRVKTRDRKDGKEKVYEGSLDLPPDVYNGLILTVTKNLPAGAAGTCHIVAFTPQPRVIQLEVAPQGEHIVLIGEKKKTAVHYVLKPQLGTWLNFFAKLLGRMPPPYNAWIITDEVPTFVRFEGPLFTTGPIWRIELTSPRWPD